MRRFFHTMIDARQSAHPSDWPRRVGVFGSGDLARVIPEELDGASPTGLPYVHIQDVCGAPFYYVLETGSTSKDLRAIIDLWELPTPFPGVVASVLSAPSRREGGSWPTPFGNFYASFPVRHRSGPSGSVVRQMTDVLSHELAHSFGLDTNVAWDQEEVNGAIIGGDTIWGGVRLDRVREGYIVGVDIHANAPAEAMVGTTGGLEHRTLLELLGRPVALEDLLKAVVTRVVFQSELIWGFSSLGGR